MAVEAEVKVKTEDPEMCMRLLKDMGFVQGDTLYECDTYYMAEHHDFAGLDEALRVRVTRNETNGDSRSYLTWKGAKLDRTTASREELESEIDDAEIVMRILQKIGFQPVPSLEKRRVHYHKEDLTVCLDEVTEVGMYLEAEIVVEEEYQREAAVMRIAELLEKMGFSMKDVITASYLEMRLGKMKNSR